MTVPTPHASALAEIPVKQHTVDLLGGTTHYWTYGPADAAHTVLLVHGYRGDHHGLEPVIARLPDIHFISPDLPAFGASTPMSEAPLSVAGYARWLDAFVTSIGVKGSAVVLGHSFGSMVVTYAIADGLPAPKLILVNPISTDPKKGGGAFLNALTRAFYGAARRVPQPVGRAMLGNRLIVWFVTATLAKTGDAELKRWIHEEHLRYFSAFSSPATVAEGFDASISTNVTRYAAALKMPVLIIAGQEDIVAPAAGQHAFADSLPDARLVMLDGVGHLVHYEKPQDAADAIREFLG